MRKINFWCLTLFTFCALVQHSKVAYAITIDSFEGASQSITANAGSPSTTSVLQADSAIGGTRSLSVAHVSGPLDITIKTQNGLLSHSQESLTTGQSKITWDADMTPDVTVPSNPTGLNMLNLMEDDNGGSKPADAFELQITKFDFPSNKPITVSILVYEHNALGNRYSIFTDTISQALSNFTLTVPFANFTKGPGAVLAADFTKVGAISLIIDGLNDDVDLTIDHFRTNGECDTFPVGGTIYGPCGCINLGDFCLDCEGTPFGSKTPDTTCDDSGEPGVCKEGKYLLDCSCKSNINPGSEVEKCDGLDNDCDGQTDEGLFDLCGVCGGNNACLDCADIPFGTTTVDQCGVCGGDGTSCLDCASAPFGTAVIDQCGVCNGDNSSCIKCEDRNISDLQFELDHGAKLQERLIKQMLRVLTNKDKKKKTFSYAKQTSELAHTLQLRNWVLSWTPPSLQRICDNTVLCTQISNEDILSEYRINSIQLKEIGEQVLKRLKKAKLSTKKFARRNQAQHDANMVLLEQVPLARSAGC